MSNPLVLPWAAREGGYWGYTLTGALQQPAVQWVCEG